MGTDHSKKTLVSLTLEIALRGAEGGPKRCGQGLDEEKQIKAVISYSILMYLMNLVNLMINKSMYPHVCRPYWEGPSLSCSIHPHRCRKWLLCVWPRCEEDIYCRLKTPTLSGKTLLCRLEEEEEGADVVGVFMVG